MIQKIVLCFLCLFAGAEAKHKEKIPDGAVISVVGYHEFHHGGTILIEEIGNSDWIYFYSLKMRNFTPDISMKLEFLEEKETSYYSLKMDKHGHADAVLYPHIQRRARRDIEFTFHWQKEHHSFAVSVFPKEWDFNPPESKISDYEAYGKK